MNIAERQDNQTNRRQAGDRRKVFKSDEKNNEQKSAQIFDATLQKAPRICDAYERKTTNKQKKSMRIGRKNDF